MFETIQVIGWGMFIEIFLRVLDLAFRRPFCYDGLHSPRHCLLQQRWLISFCLSPNPKDDCSQLFTNSLKVDTLIELIRDKLDYFSLFTIVK